MTATGIIESFTVEKEVGNKESLFLAKTDEKEKSKRLLRQSKCINTPHFFGNNHLFIMVFIVCEYEYNSFFISRVFLHDSIPSLNQIFILNTKFSVTLIH